MTAERTRPTRPPSRWADATCGVPGCPCHHDPVWSPSNTPCDRGLSPASAAQTTPGARGPGGIQLTTGVHSDDAVARCRTCKAHADSREARQ